MSRIASFRTALGFVIAPVSPGLLLLAISIFMNRSGEGLWGMQLAALVGYPFALGLGLPIHILLTRYGLVRVEYYALTGAAFGVVAYFATIPPVTRLNGSLGLDADKLRIVPAWLLLVMLLGAIAAVCFWLIVRPDHSSVGAQSPSSGIGAS
jgi:hypothetical protein